jgi:uncharacterized DUF497 family protein
MQRIIQVVWDLDEDEEGNVAHIAEHGLTIEDVEEVLDDPWFEGVANHGRPCCYGESGGRVVKVVFEWIDAGVVYPVTAYEVTLG